MAPADFVGATLRDFPLEVSGPDGAVSRTSLAALRQSGLPLLVDFFAPWCKACPAAAQKLDHLASGAYAGRCVFVLVSVDGGLAAARAWAATHGVGHCVVAAADEDEELGEKCGVSGLPHHMLVSAEGVVVKNYKVDLPADLDALLAPSTAAVDVTPRAEAAAGSRVSAEYKELEKADPLLRENPRRWVMFPIQHPEIWEMYKKHEASFWTAEDVDLSQDARDWEGLQDPERHFVKQLLANFVASDAAVKESLASQFSAEVQIAEARAFYGFQTGMENIHSEACSLLLEQYVRDPEARDGLFEAVYTMPAARTKAAWSQQWMSKEASFAERMAAFAAVEGVLFSGSSCALYWLKKRGLLPGLTFANELISRDVGLHADFACLLYGSLQHRLPDDVAHDIVRGAVKAEQEFICEALSCDVIGLDKEDMTKYIECVADRLLTALGHPKLFHSSDPFGWRELFSSQGKSSFFEKPVAKQAAVVAPPAEESRTFVLDADF